MKTKQKDESGFGLVEILLILLIFVIIGGVGFLVYQRSQSSDKDTETTSETSKDGIPAGFVKYSNADLGLEFMYPSAWGTITVRSPEDNYQQTLIFSDNDSILSLLEEPTHSVGAQGPVVPTFTPWEEWHAGMAPTYPTFPDGTKGKDELISSTDQGFMYIYCVYDLGLNMSKKVGPEANVFTLSQSFGTTTGYPDQPACSKDQTSLKQQVGNKRLEQFKQIYDSVRGI
jgi:hypothetical protein